MFIIIKLKWPSCFPLIDTYLRSIQNPFQSNFYEKRCSIWNIPFWESKIDNRLGKILKWVGGLGSFMVNANELGSELFKFYSSYPLIPKLYNTLSSISKNLVSRDVWKEIFHRIFKVAVTGVIFSISIIGRIFVQKKKISKNLSNFTFFTIMGSPEFWFHSKNLGQFWASITAVA